MRGKKIIPVFWALSLTLMACGGQKVEEEVSESQELFEKVEESAATASSEEIVKVPELLRGTPKEEGIHEECIGLMEDIIKTDIENGFTSAQVAITRHGKLVYEGAFGKVNSYNKDGSINTESSDVTNDTLYDLASVTKMFSVNYALQKMVTDGIITIDDKISDHLGSSFYEDTIFIDYKDGSGADLDTIKEWKKNLKIADLLRHEGGFPASPRYHNPHVDQVTQEYDPEFESILFSSCLADEEAKKLTFDRICQTPLMYEPGTDRVYSDVDYMVLGFVVEKVSGMTLDEYVKTNFCEPLGLAHMTYKPLENGFTKEDCAATELNGNTRDGAVVFDGLRTDTVQGEAHDEMAYYCMGGVSGHAGLFSNAVDVAKMANLMLTGEFDGKTFFSQEVIDTFTAPVSNSVTNLGLGWWRQGNTERTKYFGTKAGSRCFGHQGWTGTFFMVDPDKEIVIVILTNKINSPVTDKDNNPNKFDGNFYTTGNLGFVAELVYTGLDEDRDVSVDLSEYVNGLYESAKDDVKSSFSEEHPARRNLKSKEELLTRWSVE